jgi:hypothetical protein
MAWRCNAIVDAMPRTRFKAMPEPKANTPALRGKRQQVALTLPPDLVVEVDARAAQEDRSRNKMIELLLRAALARPSRRAA